MHPVLESLRNTDRQWLIDTLYAFNSGNVETFQALKSAWGQQVREGVAVSVQGLIFREVTWILDTLRMPGPGALVSL